MEIATWLKIAATALNIGAFLGLGIFLGVARAKAKKASSGDAPDLIGDMPTRLVIEMRDVAADGSTGAPRKVEIRLGLPDG